MQTEIVIGESLLSPLKIYSLCNDGESFYAVAIFDRAATTSLTCRSEVGDEK